MEGWGGGGEVAVVNRLWLLFFSVQQSAKLFVCSLVGCLTC